MSTIPGVSLSGGVRVLNAAKPVDFRKGANGLAALAKEVLALPTSDFRPKCFGFIERMLCCPQRVRQTRVVGKRGAAAE